jgi:hypothetical protein
MVSLEVENEYENIDIAIEITNQIKYWLELVFSHIF